MFKRRRPDDPNDADASLPAGIDDSDDEPAAHGDVALSTLRESSSRDFGLKDSGLGVPPFLPAPPKEALVMSRSPFPTISPVTPAPSAGAAPPAAPRPAAPAPARPIETRPIEAREPGERRTLVVGRGISVQGTVQDAERLVVEGTVEASMIHAAELAIAQGGMFKGEVEVEDAEISGTFNGTLTARGNLIVRSTGRVLGQARYRRLQVEDGGQISGQMEMLTEGAKLDSPVRTHVPEHAA